MVFSDKSILIVERKLAMDFSLKNWLKLILFYYLSAIFIVLFFSSCKDGDSITEPAMTTSREMPDNAIPGVAYLGCGYDAYGEYAATNSVMFPIIDFRYYSEIEARGNTYKLPEDVRYLFLNDYTYASTYGRYASEYLNKMTQSASLSTSYGGFFSSTVTTNFSEEKYTSYDYAFCSIHRCVRFWRLSLPYTDFDKLRSMMLAEAKDDIDHLDPLLLFKKYGTHLTTEVIIGARADYHCEVEKNLSTLEIKTKISACAEASFKKFTGSGDYSGEWDEYVKIFRFNSSTYLRVTGGRAEYGMLISEEGEYRDWLDTIEENPVLCSFTGNSLLPIWDLCENEARRQEVLNVFSEFAGTRRLPDIVKTVITDMKVISLDNSYVEPHLDFGYKYLPVDLNATVGGKYIYIQYKEGLEGEDAIDSIGCVIQGQDGYIPEGWVKLPQDLNAGAGGDDIFLCYKKVKQPQNPIRRLLVTINNQEIPDDFEVVKNLGWDGIQDLNRHAGGAFIWLSFSREQPRNDAWGE